MSRLLAYFGVAFLTMCCLHWPPLAWSQEREWTWIDRNCNQKTRADLVGLIAEQSKSGPPINGTRVDLKGASLRGANLEHMSLRLADLSGADLSLARLSHADLRGADMSASYLMGTDLTEADLSNAKMAKASVLPMLPSGCALSAAQIQVGALTFIQWFIHDAFPHANFTKSNLSGANLEGANLSFAVLKEASLSRTNLTGANMGQTDLSYANLQLTEMTGSVLFGANLQGTVFEPKSLPDINMLALSRNLEFLTYERLPAPLYGLRRQLQDGGFREQQRQITYALMLTQARHLRRACSINRLQDCLEYSFDTLLFDWTCRYGLRPGRPLLLLGILWVIMGFTYWSFIHLGRRTSIHLVFKSLDGRTRVVGIRGSSNKTSSRKGALVVVRREWRLLRIALFFSSVRAFSIGYQVLRFGEWLYTLTKRDYEVKAVGWARTVAGFQSLAGVYLLALWLLTYLGRPFAQ